MRLEPASATIEHHNIKTRQRFVGTTAFSQEQILAAAAGCSSSFSDAAPQQHDGSATDSGGGSSRTYAQHSTQLQDSDEEMIDAHAEQAEAAAAGTTSQRSLPSAHGGKTCRKQQPQQHADDGDDSGMDEWMRQQWDEGMCVCRGAHACAAPACMISASDPLPLGE